MPGLVSYEVCFIKSSAKKGCGFVGVTIRQLESSHFSQVLLRSHLVLRSLFGVHSDLVTFGVRSDFLEVRSYLGVRVTLAIFWLILEV